jgi:MFS family permease
MPVFGAISDRAGRKRPYLAAVAIFALGSLVAGAALSMPVLIGGRVIQGVGAGGILAVSLIIFGDLFAGPARGRMQGWITAVWGVASIVGPLAGGLIVDAWSWRWVFYLNLPLAAIVMGLAGTALHETTQARASHRLDLAGTGAFLAGVTLLMYALLEPAGVRVGALALAALALVAFVLLERRAPDPLLPLGLFRRAAFAAGSAVAALSGAAMFGALIHVPLLVQWGRGTDATTAGISLMTMSTGWSAGGLVAGQLLHRTGFWGLAVTGLALMTVGYVGLAAWPAMSWDALLLVGGVVGVGMGLASITLIVATQTLVPLAQRGVATAGILFFRNIGATVGVAVMGGALTRRLGVDATRLGAGPAALPPALAAALVDGIGAVFWLGVAASALGLLAACFLPRRELTG